MKKKNSVKLGNRSAGGNRVTATPRGAIFVLFLFCFFLCFSVSLSFDFDFVFFEEKRRKLKKKNTNEERTAAGHKPRNK